MIWCIVTADQREIDSGDLDLFLASIKGYKVQCIVILREVIDSVARRYASMPQVAAVQGVPQCGVSAARNAGLEVLSRSGASDSDYVSFPDDDCKYSRSFFETFYDVLDKCNMPELIMGSYGESVPEFGEWRKATASDALLRVSSVGLFATWGLLQKECYFNEGLGVGSGNVSYGEDNDMAFRLFRRSRSSIYARSLRVWHLEDRVTTGRNHKGYLTVAALHVPQPTAIGLLLRGVGSAAIRDLVGLDPSVKELKAVSRALNFRSLRRAKAVATRMPGAAVV